MKKRANNNKMKKGFTIGLMILLFLSCTFSILLSAEEPNDDENITQDKIILSYSFEKPTIEKVLFGNNCYDKVSMPDAICTGDPGFPNLPVQKAYILLNQGSKVNSIKIISSNSISLGTGFIVVPGDLPVKFSQIENTQYPVPDDEIYCSTELFPISLYTNVGTYNFRGYKILILTLHPVQYIPSIGELLYHEEITVTVNLVDDGTINPLFRGLDKDKLEVLKKIDNPSAIKKYIEKQQNFLSETYDLLIITADDFKLGFEPLKQAHDLNGLKTVIYTVEDIYDNYTGIDSQDKIRKFIRYAYTNWEIEYVLLGGDDSYAYQHYIIPARMLFASGPPNTWTTYMPSDLYYSCLDGTFNYDNDDKWGEPTDGENSGDVDLLADVYIGRACVGEMSEVENFVNKTITYMNTPQNDPYLKEVLWVGEHVGGGGIADWGGNYKEEIIDGSGNHGYTTVGVPTDKYSVTRLYERDGAWTKSDLINEINNNIHFINHAGHAAYGYIMKIYRGDISSLENEKPCFIYSLACFAGGFDDPEGQDSIGEYLTVKTRHGAVAGVWNAREGIAAYGTTNCPSQRFDREFWDAVFGEHIPIFGRANQDAKDDVLYLINEPFMRWCCYEQNLFGDPTLAFYPNEPPDIPAKPNGPQKGQPGKEYTFRTESSDSGIDQIYYMWDWDDGNISDWEGPFDSGEETTASHTWINKGIYEIRVKAKDKAGAESEWSQPLSIDIKTSRMKIGDITGGLGKINVIIENDGDVDIEDVEWSISIEGGMLGMINITSEDDIDEIKAEDSETVCTDGFIMGFGKVKIKIIAEADDVDKVTKSADGFVFGMFVIGIK